MTFVKKRLYLLVAFLGAYLVYSAVHEGGHYLACRLLGEEVVEFRFLTNGWLSSQVIYATPVSERVGVRWLVIAWLPAVMTTLIGYLVYGSRHRWLTRWPWVNVLLWYIGACFLLFDPFYYAVLSLWFGGDIHAATAVGWPVWPIRTIAVIVLALNGWLVLRWQREARARPEVYRPATSFG